MIITATDFVFVYMILSPYLSYGIETESVVFENSEQSGKDRRDDILSASLPLWNQILTEQEKGIFFRIYFLIRVPNIFLFIVLYFSSI